MAYLSVIGVFFDTSSQYGIMRFATDQAYQSPSRRLCDPSIAVVAIWTHAESGHNSLVVEQRVLRPSFPSSRVKGAHLDSPYG